MFGHNFSNGRIARAFALGIFLAALPGCGGEKAPAITRTIGNETEDVPLELASFTGKRDGYFAEGVMVFTKAADAPAPAGAEYPDSLSIEIKIEAGVPSRFISGRYSLLLPSVRFRGSASARSISFFGGQGGVPSIAGEFYFETEFGQRYDVRLPATEMHRPD